ncbi:Ldh family oxidoreductase [Candidatus Sumerlaeota bacterium]|nr:Ldh family oxidoreductase [Candidatus Sumerlaeota bacterium]
MNRYAHGDVQLLVASLAAAAGVPEDDAAILAHSLVDADLHGISTHGVSRLNIYVRRIQRGLIAPAAELVVEQRRPAALSVDANNGLGQVQAVKTLERLIPLAREHGVAAATIRRSQHFGALSYYCNLAASKDMVLIAMTNCEPAMSPEGGCEAFFGTNPIAVSFPTNREYAVRIDLATSLVARGNIIAAHKAGKPIPEGWALDVDGNPTTDAAAALAGTVLAMAGHKGAALAMMVEMFSGVLSGAAVGSNVGSMYKHMDREQNVGHFFCLMDVAAFIDIGELKRRIDDTIDRIKACRKRPGVSEILVPGEPEYRKAQHNRQHGIPIGDETIGELGTLSGEYGIAFALSPLPHPNDA